MPAPSQVHPHILWQAMNLWPAHRVCPARPSRPCGSAYFLIVSPHSQPHLGEAGPKCFVYFSVGQTQLARGAHLLARPAGAWTNSSWGVRTGGQGHQCVCAHTGQLLTAMGVGPPVGLCRTAFSQTLHPGALLPPHKSQTQALSSIRHSSRSLLSPEPAHAEGSDSAPCLSAGSFRVSGAIQSWTKVFLKGSMGQRVSGSMGQWVNGTRECC